MFKKIFQLTVILFFTACANNLHELAKLENGLKLDSFYTSYLALEYLEYSRNLSKAGRWRDSEHFANKGLWVAKGRKIVPESPILWRVDTNELEDAIMVQKRLENVSFYEVQKALPIQMAHLFFLYDCWISNDGPNRSFRNDEMSKCKMRFYKLLEEVEVYVDDLRRDRQPKTIITEPEFERFEINFDLDEYNINDKANKKLIDVIKYLDSLNGEYRILLVGSADRSGNSLYNENLALRRVEIVQNYLLKNGVAFDLIQSRSFGEDFPDIITQKGVQQQSNRVVAIYVLKSGGSFSLLPLPIIVNHAYKSEILRARAERGLQ